MGDFKSILIFFSLLVSPRPPKADSLVSFSMKQNSIYISERRVKWRQQKVSLVFPLFPLAEMLRIFRVLVQQHREDWNVFGQNAAICKCFRGISQMGWFVASAGPDWVLNQSTASSYELSKVLTRIYSSRVRTCLSQVDFVEILSRHNYIKTLGRILKQSKKAILTVANKQTSMRSKLKL